MSKSKTLFTVLLLTVVAVVAPVAGAQTVHIQAAGSSALFQAMEVAAVNDLGGAVLTANPTWSIHHYTVKSACPGACEAELHDSRTNPGIGPIPNEPGNLWVAWSQDAGGGVHDIWTDISVDSTVGVRTFLSRPNGGTGSAVSYLIDAATKTTVSAVNIVPASLLKFGVNSGTTGCGAAQTTCDDQFLNATVYTAIQGKVLNVGLTDIRPEDAKYATKRAAGPASNGSSLGYGTIGSQLLTQAIQSAFSSSIATPVEFGLIGSTDPISLSAVPTTIEVVPIGQAPIVFFANKKNAAGFGALDAPLQPSFADLNDNLGAVGNPLSGLFAGNDCEGGNSVFSNNAGVQSLLSANGGAGTANFPIVTIKREALSGTMNTTEFTEFRTHGTFNVNPYAPIAGAALGGSQEFNINPSVAGNNPLNKACNVAGTRMGAVGSGELVSEVKTISDSIGYAFFSFSNVSSIANTSSYGYFTIDHVDPIFSSYNGTAGDPGQPADSTGANTTNGNQEWGVLPVCTPGGSATVPNCTTATIWAGGNSYPHLRDGTYRSWSLLRALCDTADTHCRAGVDALGMEGLATALQADIIAGTGVPDFLPFSQISFVRSHYNYVQFSGTEKSVPFVHFVDTPTATLDIPAVGFEEGGDAGGCILPLATNNSSAPVTSVAGATKYNIGATTGNPFVSGQAFSAFGIANAVDNGFNFGPAGETAGAGFVKIAPGPGGAAGAGGFVANGQTNCFQ